MGQCLELKMSSGILKRLTAATCLAAALIFGGCEDDEGDPDVGDNNANLVICVGDSITQGFACDGAPYPSQLAGMTSKTVYNYGSGGVRASTGASKIKSQLACKPGYVCILYGANDAIAGGDAGLVKEYIRAIISACKNNKSIPIVATTPPMIASHKIYNGATRAVNEAIRAVAKEEKVSCVDLYKAFGDGEKYLIPDGLHPNAEGAKLIAKCFAGKL